MDERNEKNEGEIRINSPLLEKLENFWYHYKWHSIVALFLVIAITVMSLQMCKKTEYDAHVLYAGTHEISHSSADGETPYYTATGSLKRAVEDFNGDGSVNVSLLNLFVLNDAEIEAALAGTEGKEINEALILEDTETLKNTLLFGEYYVCFLSERLFLEYDAQYEGALFAEVANYIGDVECETVSGRGVYLRSLAYYDLPEICNLPDDTVVCLRKLSEVSTLFGKAANEENFRRGEIVFRNIISYE